MGFRESTWHARLWDGRSKQASSSGTTRVFHICPTRQSLQQALFKAQGSKDDQYVYGEVAVIQAIEGLRKNLSGIQAAQMVAGGQQTVCHWWETRLVEETVHVAFGLLSPGLGEARLEYERCRLGHYFVDAALSS